ncbi:hypothetical protein I551_5196 [Mycobacterium ulcerans str. Harvey]|uniref:Uncharacterized protein n=1 Tax=Mycobacterium ulcerans str. Harvey TaxID=1299332 RepID=A0ABN0QU64_MYCUL|nr:hypothetical protein I551_5196 [Mycobacterium ulcerans str. Harvey]
MRKVQDHARAADAPDEVITQAAELLERVSILLAPFDADEWESPSGRRMDLPMRGNVTTIPMSARKTQDGRIGGWPASPGSTSDAKARSMVVRWACCSTRSWA